MNVKFTVAAIALLAVIGGSGYFLWNQSETAEPAETSETTPPPSQDVPQNQFLPPRDSGGQGRHPDLPPRDNDSTEKPDRKDITEASINTDAGEKYGIDIAGIVKFLNSNATFRKVLKGFSAVNLVFTTGSDEVKLTALLNGSGAISEINDGFSDSAAFTLKVPLSEVQNILANYQNMKIQDVLGILSRVEISPESMKSELLKKVISG